MFWRDDRPGGPPSQLQSTPKIIFVLLFTGSLSSDLFDPFFPRTWPLFLHATSSRISNNNYNKRQQQRSLNIKFVAFSLTSHLFCMFRNQLYMFLRFPSNRFSLKYNRDSQIPAFFLNALINPLVLASCFVFSPLSSSSAWIFFAKDLPSSTPHWSKLLMFHTAPSVKVKCS